MLKNLRNTKLLQSCLRRKVCCLQWETERDGWLSRHWIVTGLWTWDHSSRNCSSGQREQPEERQQRAPGSAGETQQEEIGAGKTDGSHIGGTEHSAPWAAECLCLQCLSVLWMRLVAFLLHSNPQGSGRTGSSLILHQISFSWFLKKFCFCFLETTLFCLCYI